MLVALVPSGCVYVTSYRYLHVAEQTDHPGRFYFQTAGVRFGGELEESRTLYWSRTAPMLIPGHNPFHLRLFREAKQPHVQVTRISLTDIEGKVLFSAQGDEILRSSEIPAKERWVPVLS
ncbi:MAG: hypothetical protein GY778_31590, partial [bacterium]|nr:hypothetical protein [bacterium]